MDHKPRIDLNRFQLKKIKGKYIIKFGLYIIVLVSLWFWYQSRVKAKSETRVNLEGKINNPSNIELENFEIEP